MHFNLRKHQVENQFLQCATLFVESKTFYQDFFARSQKNFLHPLIKFLSELLTGRISDVARPLTRPRPPIFSRPRPLLLKTIKLLTQDLKKTFHYRKNQAIYAGFAQSCQYYAGNRKKLLITGFLVKFCFIQN